MKLSVGVYAEEVKRGLEYKGHVKFGEPFNFTYGMGCDSDLGELESLLETDREAALKQIHLKFDLNGKRVQIPDNMRPLFHGLVVQTASNLYNDADAARGIFEDFSLERERLWSDLEKNFS